MTENFSVYTALNLAISFFKNGEAGKYWYDFIPAKQHISITTAVFLKN